MADIIFEPLRFRNLTVKNRIFRSNISGRFDNYDGSGNQARINWELLEKRIARSAEAYQRPRTGRSEHPRSIGAHSRRRK